MNSAVDAGSAYRFRVMAGAVALYYGDVCLAEGLAVTLTTDSGIQEVLSLQESAEGEVETLTLGSLDQGTSCRLMLETKDTSGLLSCDLAMQQRAFQRDPSIAAEQGIRIQFAQLPAAGRWLALYRHKDWWSRPEFGIDLEKIPARTQALSIEQAGRHLVFTPVAHGGYTAEIVGRPQGGICLVISSNCGGLNTCQATVLAFGLHEDPFQAIEKSVSFARGKFPGTLPMHQRGWPAMMDQLGWCSWDAFYHQVNEAGIRAKAIEFVQQGVPVRWMIIDDGWLQTKDQKLMAFSEDREKFPSGFKSFINELKTTYGIRQIGVWHSLAGYWGGVHPQSTLAVEQAGHLQATRNQKLVPAADSELGFGFWDAWYAYLAECGVDFVKVDGQSAVSNHFRYLLPVGEAVQGTHMALERAVAKHFAHSIINCMGMATENLWNRPFSAVSRNSDDYVPQQVDGFAEHALQNVYNSFYHSQFHWGDWDMFWTSHDQSRQQAVLRVISGGPVYISDPVGATDAALLTPLLHEDGMVIHCDQPGLPTQDMLYRNPLVEPTVLKIFNKTGGAGLVACFAISTHVGTLSATVGFSDIPGMEDADGYVYEALTGELRALRSAETLPMEMAQGACAIFELMPRLRFATPIGILGLYVPKAGVGREEELSGANRFHLRDSGWFGFVLEEEGLPILLNGVPVEVVLPLHESMAIPAYKVAVKSGDVVEIHSRKPYAV